MFREHNAARALPVVTSTTPLFHAEWNDLAACLYQHEPIKMDPTLAAEWAAINFTVFESHICPGEGPAPPLPHAYL